MGILAGFCPQSICLAVALLIEALAWAALQILKMHFEAARDYALLMECRQPKP